MPLAEVQLYRGVARQVEAGFGGGLEIRPARPAEIVWMHQHAVHRGQAEPLLSDAETSRTRGGRIVGAQLRSPSYASLGQVRLLEGGIEPAPGAGVEERGGLRRWLASDRWNDRSMSESRMRNRSLEHWVRRV